MVKMARGMGGHQQAGNGLNVWLTPPEIVQRLGPFDLDPCFGSPRPWDTAAKHYGPEDDGLLKDWHGFVWCNPPYDAHSADWLKRCAEHRNAIALIFARTETAAFHKWVWNKADAVFFPKGRLFFHHQSGARAKNNGGAPSVFVAYGDLAVWRLENASLNGHLIKLKGD